MNRLALTLFSLLLITSVFYFSWVPGHNFRNLGILPDWLADWADRHGNFRTSVPFFFLGIVFELLMKKRNSWRKRIVFWLILFLIVCISELGQLLLPGRFPSFEDVFWGGAGTIAGMATGGFINFIFTPEGE